MLRQGKIESYTHWGAYTYLLVQSLDGQVALVDCLQKSTIVRMEAIQYADETLRNLGTFTFFPSHIFYWGGRHLSVVTELFCFIDILKGLQAKVLGVLSSPHLSTILIYELPRRWRLYLNRCVNVLASEALEEPGGNTTLTFDPILLELGGRCHVGLIITGPI